MGWSRQWTKIAHYAYPAGGLLVLGACLVLSEPGRDTLVVGPLRFDAFWAGVGAALCLLALSAIDPYDPAEYGQEPDD